ncbi:MAG: ribonuclease P protein component [Bacteroidaceae bacterium]
MKLCKAERIHSKKLIDILFSGEQESFFVFPLRVVYGSVDALNDEPFSILVNAPKKHFKNAVDRNRIKRQLRESYRKHKSILLDQVCESGGDDVHYAIAFLYQVPQMMSSVHIDKVMVKVLQKIASTIRETKEKESC